MKGFFATVILKGLKLAVFLSLFLFLACATTHERLMDAGMSPVQLRNMQSRVFETADRENTMRTVIATLQDLGFIIDKADLDLGSVTGTKLNTYALRMTVTVCPRGESRLVVRANAQFNIEPVIDPQPYVSFFTSLEKAMFLKAQAVE